MTDHAPCTPDPRYCGCDHVPCEHRPACSTPRCHNPVYCDGLCNECFHQWLHDQGDKRWSEGFTQGPWRFDGEPSNHIVWHGEDNRVCFLASTGRTTANARLIAAAPDLYEALSLTVSNFAGFMNEGERQRCWKALAKARGEA